MHKWIMEKANELKDDINLVGCDNLTNEQVERAYCMSKILKNLICIDKDYQIVEAMEDAELEDKIDALKMYENYPKYRMPLNMYHSYSAEELRDMDKRNGKMYYTEPHMSKYETAKKNYEESKQTHKDNTPDSKQMKLRDLENYMKELSDDVVSLIADTTPEEKTMLKNKMQVLMQKL